MSDTAALRARLEAHRERERAAKAAKALPAPMQPAPVERERWCRPCDMQPPAILAMNAHHVREFAQYETSYQHGLAMKAQHQTPWRPFGSAWEIKA